MEMKSILFLSAFFSLYYFSCCELGLKLPEDEDRAKLLRYISVLTGQAIANYYNVNGEFEGLLIQYVIPVDVPAFPKHIVFMYEESFYDEIMVREMIVLHEGLDGVVYGKSYNFTGIYDDKRGAFNVSRLQQMTLSDFKEYPECVWTVSEMTNAVFIGHWPYCHLPLDNFIPGYVIAWTCGSLGYISTDDPRYPGVKPRIYYVTERYPLLPYMTKGVTDFHDPCLNKEWMP